MSGNLRFYITQSRRAVLRFKMDAEPLVAAIATHAAPTPPALRALAAQGVPFIATGLCDQWEAREWELPVLGSAFGSAPTCIRMHQQRPDNCASGASVPYEGECTYVRATLAEFCAWLEHGSDTALHGALTSFPRDEWVGYCDYQDLSSLFVGTPEALMAVDWSTILGAAVDGDNVPRDGTHSTLWLGSNGACTPLHYDTYGAANWVSQLRGRKRWRLHPPTPGPHDGGWRCSRVPYEQSSVYARDASNGETISEAPLDRAHQVRQSQGSSHDGIDDGIGGGSSGDGSDGGNGASADGGHRNSGWMEVELRAGDVLFVPRHWWHAVCTTSDHALSINTWIDGAAADAYERMREAAVRLIACAIARAANRTLEENVAQGAEVAAGLVEPPCGWINPTEEMSGSVEEDLTLLWTAASALAPLATECGVCTDAGEGVTAMEVARVLCIGKPLEASARQLAASGHGSGANLRAPLARLLRSALVPAIAASASEARFGAAWKRLEHACGERQLRLADVIDALCTDQALDAAVIALGTLVARATAGRTSSGGKRERDEACEHTVGACDCDDTGCVVG